MLADTMVTDVRQRVLRERHGRRGMKAAPAAAHRRLQPRHQANQTRRLRLPKPGQLRKARNVAQRSHRGRVTISGQGPRSSAKSRFTRPRELGLCKM